MTPAQHYRKLAAELRARAQQEPQHHTEWDNLARCYVRLAEQADMNARQDLTFEPILRPFSSESDPR